MGAVSRAEAHSARGVRGDGPQPACREAAGKPGGAGHPAESGPARSEEHKSELQSHSDLVCRLLLEKKNKGGEVPGDERARATRSGSRVVREQRDEIGDIERWRGVSRAGDGRCGLTGLVSRGSCGSTRFSYTTLLR